MRRAANVTLRTSIPHHSRPKRRLHRTPNRLLRREKRDSRVLDPSLDPRNGALGQQWNLGGISRRPALVS